MVYFDNESAEPPRLRSSRGAPRSGRFRILFRPNENCGIGHTAKRPIRWHIYHYLTSPLGIVIIKQMCENLQNLLSVGDGRTEVLEHAAKKGNGTIGTVCVWHCINSRTLTMRCGCQATIRSRSACMGRSHSPLKSNNGLARRGPSPHPTTHPHPAGLCACLMVATCVSVCLSLPHTASPLQPTWASVY